MATVNNATGVYATLNYNFSDPNNYVENLSANAVAHLNAMPAFIQSWQAQDIANNTVGGYFQNPVVGYVNTIITVSNQMNVAANSANIDSITIAANTLYWDAQNFLAHTNRISGVTAYTGDNTVPYYNNAMNLGKTALYITNQTDNITNTAPIMGSFTSILVGPQIYSSANTMSADYIILTAGISANNLSNSQITQILSDIANTDSLLVTRQNADVTYFTNLQTFVNNYNTVKQFSNMGETQTYLLNNFIGTDKLKSRINS
jgi:hypothetical protein